MATTTIQAAEGRGALNIRYMIGRFLGWVILAGFGAWFIWNLITAPQQVASVLLAGSTTARSTRLIALGYTLVYGIIELINFAHGDLFMLGTIFASYFMVTLLGMTTVSALSWVALVAGLVATAACAPGSTWAPSGSPTGGSDGPPSSPP